QVALLLDGNHVVRLHGQCDLPAFQPESRFAEEVAPPSMQRRHVGTVVAGNGLEILDRGDDLGSHTMTLAGHFQEDLEQIDGGAIAIGKSAALGNARQLLLGNLKGSSYTGKAILSCS